MNSTEPIPDNPMPDAHCTSQYNVGVLDVVGVTIGWFTVFRWILVVLFADDVNVLCCLPNSKRLGSGMFKSFILMVFSFGSLIYTIVQAAKCGEKLVAALMVFAGLYDMIFTIAKDSLHFMFLGICCFCPLPDVALISASAVAITYGGQLRVLGIAALVIFAVLSLPFFNKPYHDDRSTYIAGPLAIKYTIIYPILLACFITIIVKDHHQWIPQPQTKLEQYLLAAKIISGTGMLDISAAVFKLIKMYVCGSVNNVDNPYNLPDVETGIFWWGLKTSSHQEVNRIGLRVRSHWSQEETAPRTLGQSQPLSELIRKMEKDDSQDDAS
ncbi:hypothetical protein BGZ97_001912 [Linnemannia gamsii]|jgi:hypothetical protein|uniref:Uncharacterized protein n=1 Tax=Linnemannia gamsii TaxID=64522 RepID=A0A9P6QY15_9FUNG|nr:hypothetical protein BGZ97_001912 [Linnemannia gamsii]